MPRVGLVHALHASMAPVEAAFKRDWPEAETLNLFDESLYVEYDRVRTVTPEIERRLGMLLEYSASCGVDAILFTGSLFGAPVESIRSRLSIPVLTAYEAMIEEAFACGQRFGLLATVADTVTMIRADMERYARAHDRRYELEARQVPGALEALLAGDRRTHDGLIAKGAEAMQNCDALLLGQFSMAPALAEIPSVPGRQVLSSPTTAVAKLKATLASP